MRVECRTIPQVSACVLRCPGGYAQPLWFRQSLITGAPARCPSLSLGRTMNVQTICKSESPHLVDVSKGLHLLRHPSEESSIRHKAGSALQPQTPPVLSTPRATRSSSQQYRKLHWRPHTCRYASTNESEGLCDAKGSIMGEPVRCSPIEIVRQPAGNFPQMCMHALRFNNLKALRSAWYKNHNSVPLERSRLPIATIGKRSAGRLATLASPTPFDRHALA